jgi:hypothetical protein
MEYAPPPADIRPAEIRAQRKSTKSSIVDRQAAWPAETRADKPLDRACRLMRCGNATEQPELAENTVGIAAIAGSR